MNIGFWVMVSDLNSQSFISSDINWLVLCALSLVISGVLSPYTCVGLISVIMLLLILLLSPGYVLFLQLFVVSFPVSLRRYYHLDLYFLNLRAMGWCYGESVDISFTVKVEQFQHIKFTVSQTLFESFFNEKVENKKLLSKKMFKTKVLCTYNKEGKNQ